MAERAGSLGLLLLLDATSAWARAGGGGGYSSGGSSGGSSSSYSSSSYSSSSGSGGEMTGGEAVMLVVMLVGLVFLYVHSRRHEARTKAQRLDLDRSRTEPIAASDASFDLDRFRTRVRGAFAQIQAAWAAQDLSRVRGFMSDGVHERFSIQLREQAALGYRNRIENLKVLDLSIESLVRSEHFDVLAVRIEASASDWRESLESGRELPNTRRQERFVEVWSFLRARNAQSPNEGGLFEGQCPNCSAPVEPARAWECTSCQSALSGPPPDWVLCEITQRSEWHEPVARGIAGLKAAVGRDPGLTRQQLEDRASVLFWRLMDADREGRAEPLASVSTSEFLAAQRERLARAGDRYVGDGAVGGVTLRGVIGADASSAGSGWDRALVELRWAGSFYERRAHGGPSPTHQRRQYRHLLVMRRRAGSRSQIGRSLTSAHCSGCGAPDSGSLSGSCDYCGEVLNDGREWLFEQYLDLGGDEASALLGDLAAHEDDLDAGAELPLSAPAPASLARPSLAPPAGLADNVGLALLLRLIRLFGRH